MDASGHGAQSSQFLRAIVFVRSRHIDPRSRLYSSRDCRKTLDLGGAALQRCDNRIRMNKGFDARAIHNMELICHHRCIIIRYPACLGRRVCLQSPVALSSEFSPF